MVPMLIKDPFDFYKQRNFIHGQAKEKLGRPVARLGLYNVNEQAKTCEAVLIRDHHTDADGRWMLFHNHIFFADNKTAILFKLGLNEYSSNPI